MNSSSFRASLFTSAFAAVVFAQTVNFPPMNRLKDAERLRAAKLTTSEMKQVYEQLESTSSDTPDSWEEEVRGRRVSLGNDGGLVIQGTSLLCGGTGNCQTWVLRRSTGRWINMFEDQAPFASEFGFLQEAHAGLKDFVIAANISADAENYVIYQFDGRFYRPAQCYSATASGNPHLEKISCK